MNDRSNRLICLDKSISNKQESIKALSRSMHRPPPATSQHDQLPCDDSRSLIEARIFNARLAAKNAKLDRCIDMERQCYNDLKAIDTGVSRELSDWFFENDQWFLDRLEMFSPTD